MVSLKFVLDFEERMGFWLTKKKKDRTHQILRFHSLDICLCYSFCPYFHLLNLYLSKSY